MKSAYLIAAAASLVVASSAIAQTKHSHQHPIPVPAAAPSSVPTPTPAPAAPNAGMPAGGMNRPMMAGSGSMMNDMGKMMTDMRAMMNGTSDPAMKARMQSMHDQMAGMMANMLKMSEGMGSMMGQGSAGMDHSMMQTMPMMAMMQPTEANPYPPAEMEMHHKMMRAIGIDATETWVRKMIEHHRGAIAMSRMAQGKIADRAASRLANQTISAQERDITMLQNWLRQHGKAPQ